MDEIAHISFFLLLILPFPPSDAVDGEYFCLAFLITQLFFRSNFSNCNFKIRQNDAVKGY